MSQLGTTRKSSSLNSREPASVAAINDFSTRAPADQVPLRSNLLLTRSIRIGVEKSVANSYLPLPASQSVDEEEGDSAFLQLFNIYDRSKK